MQTTLYLDTDNDLQPLPCCYAIEAESGPTKDNRLQQRRGWVAEMIDTLGQAKEDGAEQWLYKSDIVILKDLAQLKREDPSLATCFDQVKKNVDCDVLLDSAKYPKAYPLIDVPAKQIASALLNFFSQVGIPKEVLSDQGPNFMSHKLQQVYQLLGIKRVRTTP